MVVGVKKTIQQVPSRGRISLMRLQNLTLQKRQSVTRVVYGALMITIGMVTIIVDPVKVSTDYIMDVKEGSFLYKVYENLPYELFCEVWVFNYTNGVEYMKGEDSTLKLKELGPFLFREHRTNENLTIDREHGLMSFNPKTKLEFLPDQSMGHYKDIPVYAPNIALIAMSTLFADRLGYIPNAAAYYSMKTIGSKLFLNLTVEDLLWGYRDPVVTLANTFLPGWIDFEKIGIMDRFYAEKKEHVEVVINDPGKFSIYSWNDIAGVKEQGYTDLNTSIPCNRIRGSYEGLMVSPNIDKKKILPIYRRQACRLMPIEFQEEVKGQYAFDFYRFTLQKSAFNKSSDFACTCKDKCLPDGFIDISNCYYGFPITLSKPHFIDTDPVQMAYFEGMKPDPEKYHSIVDLEPSLGVPISMKINIQVNLAVRTSSGNPITKKLDKKILPLIWLSLFCKEPPPYIVTLMNLRLVIGPPLVITAEVLLFIIGVILGIQGFHRIWKPKYKLIEPKQDEVYKPARKRSMERRMSTVLLNMSDNIGFNDDDELAKQAVSLLSITEEDNDLPDLLMADS